MFPKLQDMYPLVPGTLPARLLLRTGYSKGEKKMHSSSHARAMGALGIVGSGLWLISVIMQHRLSLFTPDGSPLHVIHQLLALTGIIGAMAGFLGLLWGRCFHGRLGPVGVIVYVLGYALIVVGGLVLLITGPVESPLFLLFPIGGLLQDIGYLFFGIAALRSARWHGWQRWAPLLAAAIGLLAIGLPMFAGITPDGPGLLAELLLGGAWLCVGLAVFTAYQHDEVVRDPVARAT